MYSNPIIVRTEVLFERIEIVYREHSLVSNNWGALPDRIYKVIYSIKDGKWNVSQRIPGEIIPAQDEYFSFGDDWQDHGTIGGIKGDE